MTEGGDYEYTENNPFDPAIIADVDDPLTSTASSGSFDHPNGKTFRFEGLTQKFSWNVFRYLGDFIHLAGIFILLLTMFKNKSVAGLSFRTALIYAILFSSRYLDLFTHSQPLYLVFFKVTYLVTSYIALYCFNKWYFSNIV